MRPRSTACVCVLPSLSRALRTAAQYAARLCQVTSMCAPPSTTSASVPLESTVVNDSKIRSAKSSWLGLGLGLGLGIELGLGLGLELGSGLGLG